MNKAEDALAALSAVYDDRSVGVDETRRRLRELQKYIAGLLEALVETDEERDI